MTIEVPSKPLYKFYNVLLKISSFFTQIFQKQTKKYASKKIVFSKIQFVNFNLILVEFKDLNSNIKYYCTVETYNRDLYMRFQQINWLNKDEELTESEKDHALQIANIAIYHTKWSKKSEN